MALPNIKRSLVGLAAGMLAVSLPGAANRASAENALATSVYGPACKRTFTSDLAPDFDQGVCMGVVAALMGTRRAHGICAPSGWTNGLAVKVVVAYIYRHPERSGEAITQTALSALREAWPCTTN